MAKPINPLPPADARWLHHFQAVSQQVRQLRREHQPHNAQGFTNRVWAKHLLKMINGGLK